jgi:hypothetical protein
MEPNIASVTVDEMRRANSSRSTLSEGLQINTGSSAAQKEDRPVDDGSTEQTKMTVGLDLGDKYSYLCVLDTKTVLDELSGTVSRRLSDAATMFGSTSGGAP